jgi:universal stress protein E
MEQIRDILVVVNPLLRDQPAIAKAATLARVLGASIELLICDTRSSRNVHMEGTIPATSNALLSNNLDLLLEGFAEPLRDDGIDVTAHVISGDPLHEAVNFWMRDCPADLVVKDTHHHSLGRRAFTTNTDWHLIRDCPVPLLLTKATVWATPPVIMAAVDPGHAKDPTAALDHRILDLTTSMTKRFGGAAHVMHSYLPSTMAVAAAGGMPAVGVSVEMQNVERSLNRLRIKQLTDAYELDDANLHVDAGMAAEYLPRMAAEWRADIVVMGAVSRSAVKRVVIGSTAERILETMPCDMLTVKPPDFARSLPF